jgi:hypothetical protein
VAQRKYLHNAYKKLLLLPTCELNKNPVSELHGKQTKLCAFAPLRWKKQKTLRLCASAVKE